MATPTDDQRLEAIRRVLVGLTRNDDAHVIADDVRDLHIKHHMFPGEVFMQLGTDALAAAGVDQQHRIDHEGLLPTYLPEASFRGKQNLRIRYALFTTFSAHGGLEPDLIEEVTYWIDNYWYYSLLAAIAVIRASGDSQGNHLDTIIADLAALHAIDLNVPS